jgi:hypothetical protein
LLYVFENKDLFFFIDLFDRKNNFHCRHIDYNSFSTSIMPRSSFIDDGCDEEDDNGLIVPFSDEDNPDDSEPNSEDLAFIDDSEIKEYQSDVSVHDSEKELDEDDYLLLEDNRRAARKSRVKAVESDDDTPEPIGVAKPTKAIPVFKKPRIIISDDEDEAPTATNAPVVTNVPAPVVVPKSKTGTIPVSQRRKFISRVEKVQVTPVNESMRPKKPVAPTSWDFLKPPTPKLLPKSVKAKSNPPPKIDTQIVSNKNGTFVVLPTGERKRLGEDGSVRL